MSADTRTSRPPPGPSPFEMLHPAGRVGSWRLRGEGSTGGLSPGRPPADRDAADIDLLLLAPSRAESGERTGIADAVEQAIAVGPDGLVAVLHPSRALAAALLENGLEM